MISIKLSGNVWDSMISIKLSDNVQNLVIMSKIERSAGAIQL